MKTLIRGGTLVTDREVQKTDLLLADGRIAALGPDLAAQVPDGGVKVVDATGKYVLPGGIDAHTHITLDLAAARGTDVFYTGTIPAALGGTTCIADHLAFRPEGDSMESELEDYLALARGRSAVDYIFHGLIQDADELGLAGLEALARLGLKSVKAYMTYERRLDDAALLKVLERTRDLGLLLIAHAEDHESIAALRARFKAEGKLAPIWHAKSRPAEAEADAVKRLLALARKAGDAPVCLAHLSSASGLAQARAARERGQKNIFVETCTQYLMFTEDAYLDEESGPRHIMSPPLRGAEDVEALWQGLANGEIQFVASDHCAFTLSDKARGQGDFTACPGGAPGLNERMSALFSAGVLGGRISAQKFVELSSAAPARIFGLQGKGSLALGANADICILNPREEAEIYLPDADAYSNYSGLNLKGRIEAVYLRGAPVALNGQYVGRRGQGAFKGEYDALS